MAKTSKNSRKPRSFDLSGERNKQTADATETTTDSRGHNKSKSSKPVKARARKPKVIEKPREIIVQPDSAVDEEYANLEQLTPPPMETARRKGFGWGKLFLASLSALVAIGTGLAVDQLIRDLFSRNDLLGWAALAIAALGALALLIVIVKELWGLSRLRTVEKLRIRAEKAKDDNDMRLAQSVSKQVRGMFENRPDTAHGRARLDEHDDAIIDGADLIKLLERDLLAPLDQTARSMVMQSAKRVSIVTAVSPRALIDIGFVLFENMRLIRRIAEHYGGKPGALSSMRLVREVLTHLAATGAIAVGDGLIQQFIGQGLAARLSARLGEGVVNGLLTARIGIAAIDVCRPLKFDAEKRPGISDFVSELTKSGKSG